MQQLVLLSDPECKGLSTKLKQAFDVFCPTIHSQNTSILHLCEDINKNQNALQAYTPEKFQGHLCLVSQDIPNVLPALRQISSTIAVDSIILIDGQLTPCKTPLLIRNTKNFVHKLEHNNQRQQNLCVWLSTSCAYEIESHMVLPDFNQYKNMQETTLRIHMATGEAYANSLLHGNLQVHAHHREIENYNGSFANDINDKLDTPDCADRLIGICARICPQKVNIRLVNEGSGFEPAQKIADAQIHKPFRGISLLQQFTDHFNYSDNGRILDLHFNLNSASAVLKT